MDDEVKYLPKDMQKEAIETKKYYKLEKIELEDVILELKCIEETRRKEIDENNEEIETIEYGLIVEFKGEEIKIATINQDGQLIPNREILENEDKKYSDEELDALGDMLNRLGLENKKVDINKLQEQLKEIKAKTKEEWDKEGEEKETGESIKDEEEQEEEKDGEEPDQELEDANDQEKEEEIADKMHVRAKDIFMIRATSQFFKNHPQVSKSTFFFKDDDGKIKARQIVDGKIEESPFFEDSTTCLMTEYVNLGNDGQDVKRERPWQVMETNNLKARDTQGIRIAARMEQGYLEFEEIRQGTNGEWTGYGLEKMGRDYNAKVVDRLSDTRTNKVAPANISDRFETVEHSGLADDGIQMQDLSPRKTIDRFIEEGYNKKEAIDIYNYMIGEEHLSEDAAKQRVNEEIEEKIEKGEREVEEDEKTPWGDAEGRRGRR